jgi:hypothetical protein
MFKHADLAEWTRENRAGLIQAVLTLVRAWFVAGKPEPSKGVSFGSFEAWERVVGGIVGTAGVSGFLANMGAWRSESDLAGQWWTAHLAWLHTTFKGGFTAAEVKSEAYGDPVGWAAPPDLDDLSAKDYTKRLGQAYHQMKDRILRNRVDDETHDYKIARDGEAHRGVAKWKVVRVVQPDGRDGGTGGTSTPTHVAGERVFVDRAPRKRVPTEQRSIDGPSSPSGPSDGAEDCPDCGRDHGAEGCR